MVRWYVLVKIYTICRCEDMAVTLVNCDYCGGTGVCPDEEYEPADCDMCEGTGCVEKELDGCVCAESP